MRSPRRRNFLKATGVVGFAGVAGIGSARGLGNGRGSGDDTLRLFSEQAVDGATEVVTQNTWAYVATGDGFAIVDWQNPTQPELVGTWDAPGTGIADVKVDGDLLAVSTQGGEHDHRPSEDPDVDPDAQIGTHLYDVRDPTDPRYLSTFQVLPEGVHNAHLVGDTLYIAKEAPFDESALIVVDVSDPANPAELSRWVLEDVHPELNSVTNFVHDVYAQGDYAYLAYWDAGCRVLDVSDPTDPTEVSWFGQTSGADRGDDGTHRDQVYAFPGNAHYVQPSPDGDHVYVGAETYAVQSGGITVFDVTDFDDPRRVATIEAEDRNPGIFPDTSHNFDVTANRLYTSWYDAGTRVYDVTDSANPKQTYEYDPDGSSFWTAVRARGFTVVSDIGGGIVFLHEDRGRTGAPGFDGADAVPHHDRKQGEN
ncbi:MAG: beta-propeller domain-containing protein [Halalkalicoccus sp.]|nr:beta-propeller domain-containing protein [Halalkalicoccus sp.]